MLTDVGAALRLSQIQNEVKIPHIPSATFVLHYQEFRYELIVPF